MSGAGTTVGSGPAADAGATVHRLGALIGRWASSGEMTDPETGERVTVTGTDEYAWLEGGWFVVHRVDVTVGGAPVRVLELIGEPDPAGAGVLCRAYGQDGGVGVMRAEVDDDGVWSFADDAMRATLRIEPGGDAMSAVWERGGDGRWGPWMRMRFERLA